MGVKGTKSISPELSEKIFQVANREEAKVLTNKQIAEIVNKEYLEETGKASNIGEGSVRNQQVQRLKKRQPDYTKDIKMNPLTRKRKRILLR